MISKFELPKDDNSQVSGAASSSSTLPAGVTQDQINKALEQSKDK